MTNYSLEHISDDIMAIVDKMFNTIGVINNKDKVIYFNHSEFKNSPKNSVEFNHVSKQIIINDSPLDVNLLKKTSIGNFIKKHDVYKDYKIDSCYDVNNMKN